MHLVDDGLLLLQRLGDVVGVFVAHPVAGDDQIPHLDDVAICLVAGIAAALDAALAVELAVFLVHLVDDVGVVDQLHLDAGRDGETADSGGWNAADPEERVDAAVGDGIDGFDDAEPLAMQVLVLVEANGLDGAGGHDLGGAARRAGRDALALEIGERLDAGAFDGHDMHAVGIDDQQRLQRYLVVLEFVLALNRIHRCIGHGEAEVALAGRDQLDVVHRAAGDLDGGVQVGQGLGQYARNRAAEREIHAAGIAGADRQLLLLSLHDAGQRQACRKRQCKSRGRLFHGLCRCHVRLLPDSLSSVRVGFHVSGWLELHLWAQPRARLRPIDACLGNRGKGHDGACRRAGLHRGWIDRGRPTVLIPASKSGGNRE